MQDKLHGVHASGCLNSCGLSIVPVGNNFVPAELIVVSLLQYYLMAHVHAMCTWRADIDQSCCLVAGTRPAASS